MTEELICSTCLITRNMELVHAPETVEMHGRDVTFEAEFYRCPICGDEIEVMGQLDRNLAAARDVYDRLYGNVSPDELVALREQYNISQKSLGALLGFGEVTINSYESGASVPQSTNRLLLKLAENPQVFKEIYLLNKDKLSDLQRRKIEQSEGWRNLAHSYFVSVATTSADYLSGVGTALPSPTYSKTSFKVQVTATGAA